MRVGLPVRAGGHSADGSAWQEMSSTADASYGGASLSLNHRVRRGQVLLLSLPLPQTFRRYSLGEPSYHVYCLVRETSDQGPPFRSGVMFLGKNPPRGFEKNPAGLYLLPTDPPPAPTERRHHERIEIFLNLRLRRLDPLGRAVQEELTVSENVGRGGLRVPTSLKPAKGESVEVGDPGGLFSTLALVRNVFVGKDGIPRINLAFDGETIPDTLLAAAGIHVGESG